jgi:lactate racemase
MLEQESRVEVELPGACGSYSLRVPARNLAEVLTPPVRHAGAPLKSLVRRALDEPVGSRPLAELVRPGTRVLVVVDDITRPTPIAQIAPLVLECLLNAGCRADDITFALALGTHRPMTPDEIVVKLGDTIPHRFPVINTPAQQRDAFVATGESWGGVPIEVNRAVTQADVVLGIGNVVPHADAGWSGGCKIVLPGMCSERTVMENHLLGMTDTTNLLGKEETPVRLNMEGVVAKIGLHYVINVAMSPGGDVIDVFGGHFVRAQRAAVAAARPLYTTPFQERVDIVVSNAYPAVLDLWQASKGIWAGEAFVRPNGLVILAAPCPEGIGPHPDYLRVLQTDPDVLMAETLAGRVADRTIVGSGVPVGHFLRRMRLVIGSPGLDPASFGSGPIQHFPDVQLALDEALAQEPGARVGVLTHGGYQLPIRA